MFPRLLVVLLLGVSLYAQERSALVVPFRADHGYLLLQTVVNGKKAVLILHTRSPVSFSNGRVLLLHARNGIVSFGFEERNPLSVQYYRPDRIAYDGILGNDVLKQFRSLRIDYKHSVVEFEE